MNLTLVILAAGMGSRYGGMKQLDRLGPSGETIMEYSIYDALQAGFNKIVFVIRKHFEKEFHEAIVKKINPHVQVQLAYQETEMLPDGFVCPKEREKPWGTGHALWVCKQLVQDPFAVINADDFYGREAFQVIAEHLRSQHPEDMGSYAMVGYHLNRTLSEHGSVSRGICRVDNKGKLKRVTEHTAIEKNEKGQIFSNQSESELDENAIVSMNFWGFTPDFFEHLESKLKLFLKENINQTKSEFYIPFVVDDLIGEDMASVKVLSSEAQWFGVTYKEDKEQAVKQLQQKVDAGVYPNKLW